MQNLKPKPGGTIFKINRPAFVAGECCCKNDGPIDISKLNERNGVGNYNIDRPSFLVPPIRARVAGDFNKLQAIDLETQGAKIQLSEKTIAELFKTKVGDKTDTKWLDEKARLTALYTVRGMTPSQITQELEVNKPLGREQRKITTNQNIAQSSLSIQDKIDEIKQEVVDGRGESRAQQALLIGQLALIFADTQAITQFTRQQAVQLAQTINRLNVPQDYRQMGLTARYIDINYYRANAGLINLYLFSSVASDPNYANGAGPLNYNTIVYNFTANANGIPPIMFQSMITVMSQNNNRNPRRFFDLERRGVISKAELDAIVLALPNGWNNPAISVDVAYR